MKTSLKHKGLAIVSSVSIILQIMLPALSVASLYSPVPARAGVCSPGQWGAPCGGNDCPASHSSQCRGDGSGWDCIWNPAQCGAQQQAPAGGAGASEWDKCKREGKSDEECRGRAEGAYIQRAQDIPPTEPEKTAHRAADEARKKALEQIEAKTEGGSSEGLNAQEYVAIQEAAKAAVEQVQEKDLTLERDQAELERIASAIGQATGERIQKEREPSESAPESEPETGPALVEESGRVCTRTGPLYIEGKCYFCSRAGERDPRRCKPSELGLDEPERVTPPITPSTGREEARRTTGLPTRPAGEFEESRGQATQIVDNAAKGSCGGPVGGGDFTDPTTGARQCYRCTGAAQYRVVACTASQAVAAAARNPTPLQSQVSSRGAAREARRTTGLPTRPAGEFEDVRRMVGSPAATPGAQDELPDVLGYLPVFIRDAQGSSVKARVEIEDQEGSTGASGAFVARGLRTGEKYKVKVTPEDGSGPIEKECPAVPFVDEYICEFRLGAGGGLGDLLREVEEIREKAVEELITFIAGKVVGQDRYKSAVTDDGHLQYTIRHVGIKREFSEDAKARIVEDVRQKWPNSQIEEKFDEVIAVAEGNNVDPLFALTIWVEESAAGGVPSKSQFGCFPGGDTSQQVPFEKSLSCFAGEVNKNYDAGLSTPENFENFIYNYCGHPDIRCDNNRNFPANVRDIYVRLLELLRSQEKGARQGKSLGLVPQVLAQETAADPIQALVTLVNSQGESHSAVSSQNGEFLLSVPGNDTYKIIVAAPGNKSVRIEKRLSAVKQYVLNVQLEEGDSEEKGGVARVQAVATKVQLQEGWNAVSPGLVPNHVTTAGELLTEIAAQGGYATTVAQWRDGRWQQFIQRATTTWGQDFALSAGEGYFIRVHMPVEVIFPGDELQTPVTYALSKGYNFVGVVSDAQLSADSLIESINKASQVARTVTRFEAGLYEPYVKQDGTAYGEDFSIEETRGYFIRVEEDITWSP